MGFKRTEPDPTAVREFAELGLGERYGLVVELGERFVGTGHQLALVGGCVRDLSMGRSPGDLDFATDARPETTIELLRGWAADIWDVGARFGTIGALAAGSRLEITTYRSDSYDPDSRKPAVAFGPTLAGDLVRRDFTVNGMAITLPDGEFVDVVGGLDDLAARVLRTPAAPEVSFGDDPLRMMRAARFASQLGFSIAPEVDAAMRAMSQRLEIVSPERIRDELSRTLLTERPRDGLEALVATGLADVVLPELPAMALETDEHHRHKDVYEHSLTVLEQAIRLEQVHEPQTGPDLVLRLAALLHDVGKPRTRRFESGGNVSFHHHDVVGAKLARKRLRALRYPKSVVDAVTTLITLHLRFHGFAGGQWTDAAVRRYVRDAGSELTRLHKLTRADCTTRNQRKAAALQTAYSELERQIAELEAADALAATRPDLDGNAIMELLGLSPGPQVGVAYRYLLERRVERGPVEPEVAAAELLAWWQTRPADSA